MPRGYSSPCGVHDYPTPSKPKRCPKCPRLIKEVVEELEARIRNDPSTPYRTRMARKKRKASGQKNRDLHGSSGVTHMHRKARAS